MASKDKAHLLYNPAEKPKEEIINEFVIRTDVFKRIMEDILTSEMKHAEQGYLIIGHRGMGKTTLLHRIKYAIQDETILKD